MAKNNIARLKKEADIERVVSHLGLETKKSGVSVFIRCPIPSHNDKHISNCYFKPGWDSVYCTVCGKSVQGIDLIMYTTNCSYGEAADTLWQLEGCPDWYKTQKPKGFKPSYEVSFDERNLIGLNTSGINASDYLSEKELKALVKKMANTRSAKLSDIENYLGEEVFKDEKKGIENIKKKAV